MAEKPTYEELEQRISGLLQEVEAHKRTEETLRRNEKMLSDILQETSIPTFVIDKDHRVTHINRAFENLTGISADEIIGTRKQWLAFYPEERPVMADLIVDNVSEEVIAGYYDGNYRKSEISDEGFEAERLFRDLKHGSKWLYFTASPLKDEEGNIIGAIETLQDVTERKKAEQALRKSERRLIDLLDFVPYPAVVFTLDGRVYHLNPEFTNIFGWTLEELEGKTIPYAPPGMQEETSEMIKKLFEDKIILRHETKRLTKDGRVLDVVMRAAIYSEAQDEPAGELVILRDITLEKRIARNNEALLRISTALPEYPDMEDLLDYVSREVKSLLDTEGALVILLDEERNELFFQGAAYDDDTTQEMVKEIRFPADKSVAGKVIRTGEPIIVPDTSKEPDFYPGVDQKLGYHTRNMLEVPLKSIDRIIGVLCGRNKKEGSFDETDLELLNMIAGTVALSIENAKFSEEIIKAYRNNEALLRISTALPMYTDLEGLLDYVSSEVKRLLESEGSLVILLDEEREELFFLGAAYDDSATQERIKEFRFSLDQLVAGKVIKTGEPLIVSDTSVDSEIHRERDKKLGYHTRNLLLVPLRSRDRIIGVLSAINKKDGGFDDRDVELLNMIAGTVALSIENARFSEELRVAYREVTSLNRAKDKVINHLSHELKTPVSVLAGSLSILTKTLESIPEKEWKGTINRSKRNLNRIMEIQSQVEDIMRDKHYKAYGILSIILEECADEMETLLAEQVGEGPAVDKIRSRIEETFGLKEASPEKIHLVEFLKERIADLSPMFSHRQLEIISRFEAGEPVYMPKDSLQKVIDGLIKNAVENTPDEGKIELIIKRQDGGTEFVVRDYGVGIMEDARQRIFEGFFATQDTMAYSSKNPFDFNAGGKGADLLRMKIFSERYDFKIDMFSSRCVFIPEETDVCPGRISRCRFCIKKEDCHRSGGTTFSLYFPSVS